MFDIAIIGAGPAGASAAIFAAKAGKKTVLVDSDKSMTKRAWVENHYGVMETTGPDLLALGKKQAEKFGAKLVNGSVEAIEKQGEGFLIKTDGESYESNQIILATGAIVDLAEKIGVETTEGTEPRIKKIIKAAQDGKTNIDGIWAAGTCAGVSVHTIITAGDGAKAAINVISELNGERYVDHDLLK